MKEKGTITRINHNEIYITMNQNDGCSTCDLGHCCQVMGSGKREIKIVSSNHNYQIGDMLEIETKARSMLTAGFFVFILPIIIAAIFYSIIFALKKSDDWAIIGFFIGFLLAEGIVFIFDKTFGRTKFFQPKIISKLNQ